MYKLMYMLNNNKKKLVMGLAYVAAVSGNALRTYSIKVTGICKDISVKIFTLCEIV